VEDPLHFVEVPRCIRILIEFHQVKDYEKDLLAARFFYSTLLTEHSKLTPESSLPLVKQQICPVNSILNNLSPETFDSSREQFPELSLNDGFELYRRDCRAIELSERSIARPGPVTNLALLRYENQSRNLRSYSQARTIRTPGLERLPVERLKQELEKVQLDLNEDKAEFQRKLAQSDKEAELEQTEALRVKGELEKLQAYVNEQRNLKSNIRTRQSSIDLASTGKTSVRPEALDKGKSTSFVAEMEKVHTIEDIKTLTADKAKNWVEILQKERDSMTSMRDSLNGSLKHLGAELYSSPLHFLREFLQNADDNIFETNCPEFRLELNVNGILISNNEVGFGPKEVRALCRLAVSTKTGGHHVGQKGLGFKSVFGATDSPHILSRAWQFMFQVDSKRDAVANYITPRWVENLPDELVEAKSTFPDYTHFWLPFKVQSNWSSEQGNTLLEATDEHLLLNMRKLRCFVVSDRRQKSAVGHIRRVRLVSGEHKVIAPIVKSGADLELLNVTSCDVQLIVDGALSDIAITGSNGTFSCSSTDLAVGQNVTISGVFGGTGSIFGYTDSCTYYVKALTRTGSYVTGFTLSASSGGSAIITTPGIPTGLTFTKSKQFRQFQCRIVIPEQIRLNESSAARRNVKTTDLTLTFPSFGSTEVSEYDTFPVYATLPICNLGFRFLLNCDWIVVTNRESVRDNQFNTFLRNATAAFFVYVGVCDAELKQRFHYFVPSNKIDSSWWLGLVNDIKTRLLDHLRQQRSFLPNPEVQKLFESYSRRAEEILDISILSEETCQLLSQKDLKQMGLQPLSVYTVDLLCGHLSIVHFFR
jgi:hypothetical protein